MTTEEYILHTLVILSSKTVFISSTDVFQKTATYKSATKVVDENTYTVMVGNEKWLLGSI